MKAQALCPYHPFLLRFNTRPLLFPTFKDSHHLKVAGASVMDLFLRCPSVRPGAPKTPQGPCSRGPGGCVPGSLAPGAPSPAVGLGPSFLWVGTSGCGCLPPGQGILFEAGPVVPPSANPDRLHSTQSLCGLLFSVVIYLRIRVYCLYKSHSSLGVCLQHVLIIPLISWFPFLFAKNLSSCFPFSLFCFASPL